MTIDEIGQGLDRLKAIDICHEMIDKYAHLYSDHQHNEIVTMWADRADSSLELPWGTYLGIEGVKRYHLEENCDISSPEAEKKYTGVMTLHSIGTYAAEVADDLQTVRMLACVDNALTYRREKGDETDSWGGWAWCEAGIDFIKEGDAWKIWHIRIFPLMLTNYHHSWAESDQDFDIPLFYNHKPDIENPNPVYNFTLDGPSADKRPEVPEPYASFAEVAPGYGA